VGEPSGFNGLPAPPSSAPRLNGRKCVLSPASRVVIQTSSLETAKWTSADAIPAALGDYLTVLAWVIGYAVYALALATLLRSVPLALAVGIGWAGPIEHIVSDSWTSAHRWFPGLLLEEVGQGGTGLVSLARALGTTAAYVAVAAAVTVLVFRRRDVTA